MDFANGLSCLINSTVSSLLGLIAGSDSYSSASKTKKFDKSIAGRFSYARQVRREYIDPQYWSVEAMKPFMNKYFLKDLNNDKISPEEIFNRYGTHVILDLIMGGKMIVDYSSYEASSYYSSDFSNAAEEIMSGSSSSYSSVSNFLNSNSDLKVHVWGGVGATAVVNTLLEYAKAVNNWSKTVYNPKNANSNIVFIDAPDLLRKQGSLTGVWNFVSEGNVERRKEIMLAYSRYLMESSYEASSMINGLDRYLSDIVFENFGSDRDSSYWATNKFNEKLYDSGRLDDDFAFIKSFEGSNGNPAKFGKGIYGAGVYAYDEDKASKGVMVTDSNSGDNSFGAHAKMIMEYFGLSDSDGNADYPIVHITLPQALLVCNMLTAAYNEVHDEKLSFAYAYDLAYEVDDCYVVKTLDTAVKYIESSAGIGLALPNSTGFRLPKAYEYEIATTVIPFDPGDLNPSCLNGIGLPAFAKTPEASVKSHFICESADILPAYVADNLNLLGMSNAIGNIRRWLDTKLDSNGDAPEYMVRSGSFMLEEREEFGLHKYFDDASDAYRSSSKYNYAFYDLGMRVARGL